MADSKIRIFAAIECISAVQGHPAMNWYQWKAHMRLPISRSCKLVALAYRAPFLRYVDLFSVSFNVLAWCEPISEFVYVCVCVCVRVTPCIGVYVHMYVYHYTLHWIVLIYFIRFAWEATVLNVLYLRHTQGPHAAEGIYDICFLLLSGCLI